MKRHRLYFEAPSATRTQEDIRQRRQMAAAYYVLRAFRSAPPWILWWSELPWSKQETP